MKKTALFAILAFGLFSFIKETLIWNIDTAHSRIDFAITHLGISEQHGNFTNYESKITCSKEDFSDAVIEFSADVASLNTGNTMRDNHLKAPDYFDAEKYPKITFKSTSFVKQKDNTYKVSGDLSFHGVTKPIVLTAVLNGVITHPMNKKPAAGFKISGVIKRSEFNFAKDTPNNILSDEVKITADVEYGR